MNMKKNIFEKLNNIPIVTVVSGLLAIIAVVVVIILLTGGSGNTGLYVNEVDGTVNIMTAEGQTLNAVTGTKLNKDDVITVSEGSSCTLDYVSGKEDKSNYIVLDSNTQILLTHEFDGKETSELYLGRGNIITNFVQNPTANVKIRTANSMIYPEGTVGKIQYITDEFDAFTNVFSFMGTMFIQLYDDKGNEVNDKEPLIEKRVAQITSKDLGPIFTYLNSEFKLEELKASDIKALITIANLIDDFPYTDDELRAVYDKITTSENTFTTSASIVTLPPVDSSEDIQTAEPVMTTAAPVTTSPITVKPPSKTTKAPVTTTAKPTETTTAATTTVIPKEQLTIILFIDGTEIICEVPYGGTLEVDAPVVAGKTFIGWDKPITNITKDMTITALFEDSAFVPETPNLIYHTVVLVIGDKTEMLQIEHGKSANLPNILDEKYKIEGQVFVGWDKSTNSVTDDMIVNAIFEPEQSIYTVTFMIMGLDFKSTVEFGGTAIPPRDVPEQDSHGNKFVGWDKPLSNITSDQTITALYETQNHTVTFVIGDNPPIMFEVENGETITPPIPPLFDEFGRSFVGWDGDYFLITSDRTITALYEFI